MFIKRASSDMEYESPKINCYNFFMLTVFLISTLSYHIHNPFMLLGSDGECRNSFAGVIFEDLDGDGAFGLREKALPGLVNLRSQFGARVRKYETDNGSFTTMKILCGTYDVLYQYDALEQEKLVGQIEVGTIMAGEVYHFIGTRPVDVNGLADEGKYSIYLPYVAR